MTFCFEKQEIHTMMKSGVCWQVRISIFIIGLRLLEEKL
jgi:hypothetical protein